MSDIKSLERCVGDYPILYEITYTDQVQHRRDVGGGDTEFSHYTRELFTRHIVAASPELARAAFDKLWAWKGSEVRDISTPKPLLVIDGYISVTRGGIV